MKTHLPLVMLMLAVAVFAQSTRDMSQTETMTFSRDRSLLEEQRRIGKHADDFQSVFPAVTIDPQTMTEVQTTKNYRLNDQPMLWFATDKSKAVLDERFFSELAMVDATRLPAAARVTLGRLKESARRLPPREIAWFLMSAGVIQTFAHIESKVVLESERAAHLEYEAVFSGSHVYFTNERNERPFKFRFIIEADGSMRVEP